MEVYITKNNLPYNADSSNVPYFEDTRARDKWLNEKLEDNLPVIWENTKSFTMTSPTEMTFRVKNNRIHDAFRKNYCYTKIQGKIQYWHITGYYSRNARTIEYTCVLDIYMNYPILSQVRNGVMTQGHIPEPLKSGLSFDGGERTIKSKEKLETLYDQADIGFGYDLETGELNEKKNFGNFLYIFFSIKSKPKGDENLTGTLVKKSDGSTVALPYAIGVFEINSTNDEDINDIFRHCSGRIIGAKISSHIPYQNIEWQVLNQAYKAGNMFVGTIATDEDGILTNDTLDFPWLLAIYEKDTTLGIDSDDNEFNMPFSEMLNTYVVDDMATKNDITDQLNGLRDWEVGIENVCTFDLPTNFYDIHYNLKKTDYRLVLERTCVPTPDIFTETYKFRLEIKQQGNEWHIMREQMRQNETVINNDKDFIFGQNAFSTYKANNPISSSLELVLAPMRGAMMGMGMGSFWGGNRMLGGMREDRYIQYDDWEGDIYDFSGIGPNGKGNIDLHINQTIPGARQKVGTQFTKRAKVMMGFGAAGAGMALARTVMRRQEMKRKPLTIKGSGNGIQDYILNDFSNGPIRITYDYTTSERDNIINGIYRDGVQVGDYVFDRFSTEFIHTNSIIRSRFNVLDISNIKESMPQSLYSTEGTEICAAIIAFYSVPRRYWHDHDNMLVYNYVEDDNHPAK